MTKLCWNFKGPLRVSKTKSALLYKVEDLMNKIYYLQHAQCLSRYQALKREQDSFNTLIDHALPLKLHAIVEAIKSK